MQNKSPLDIIKDTMLFSQYMHEQSNQEFTAWKAKYERPTQNPETLKQMGEKL